MAPEVGAQGLGAEERRWVGQPGVGGDLGHLKALTPQRPRVRAGGCSEDRVQQGPRPGPGSTEQASLAGLWRGQMEARQGERSREPEVPEEGFWLAWWATGGSGGHWSMGRVCRFCHEVTSSTLLTVGAFLW